MTVEFPDSLPIAAGQIVDAKRVDNLDTQGLYAPQLLATVTPPNLGDAGEATGAWHRQGRWITGWARFRFNGAGITSGSGVFLVTLPFEVDVGVVDALGPGGGLGAGATAVGAGWLRDASAAATCRVLTCQLVTRPDGQTYVWLAQPRAHQGVQSSTIVWAGNDRISIDFQYPRVVT